jgi:hypothetical protein
MGGRCSEALVLGSILMTLLSSINRIYKDVKVTAGETSNTDRNKTPCKASVKGTRRRKEKITLTI